MKPGRITSLSNANIFEFCFLFLAAGCHEQSAAHTCSAQAGLKTRAAQSKETEWWLQKPMTMI
ncbi:MAG: hypothetical protein JSU94_13425 [Phycisphaerales bacterium]|nr:MAG: hypothetical protein JSU94_13425 [Phycisphaerales bacterium]